MTTQETIRLLKMEMLVADDSASAEFLQPAPNSHA